MTPEAINRAADALRDWLHNEYDMAPLDAVRVLALVIGDYATQWERVVAAAKVAD